MLEQPLRISIEIVSHISMRPLAKVPLNFRSKTCLPVRCFASSPSLLPGGRTAPYRRIQYQSQPLDCLILQRLQPQIQPFSLQLLTYDRTFTKAFSTTTRAHAFSYRDLKSEGKSKEAPKSPRDKPSEEAASSKEEDPAEKAYRETQEKSEADRAYSKDRRKDDDGGDRGESSGKDQKEQKKKEDPPPPPPHGNKSPWQVFTETLRSEFKASKEWNESTKQLASSANQFTENESVKRARAAYTAAAGAATSGTASAIKGTGRALGQGAAWTWDSTVVKGVRSGVNATASGIDKATKPVRETKVYQAAVGNVKNVIDDGSSSRYGGWVEKEERRKQRELRELNESGVNGKPGKRPEKIVEDPKYGHPPDNQQKR